MKKINLTQGLFALVDDSDFEELNKFKWYAAKNAAKYYAVRNEGRGKFRRTIKMHRQILGLYDQKQYTDHVNGNGLDNRRNNLRVCSSSENQMNRGAQKNNSVGFKGVCKEKNTGFYRAYIGANGKRIYLGRFSTPLDAAKSYNEAARRLFGEFSLLNQL